MRPSVCRIGRTGRAGCKGESITFLTRSSEDTWKAIGILEVMAKTGQHPPPEVQDMVDRMLRRQQINKEQRAQENEQFTKVLMVAEKPSVAKMIAVSWRTEERLGALNSFCEHFLFFISTQLISRLQITHILSSLEFIRSYLYFSQRLRPKKGELIKKSVSLSADFIKPWASAAT